MTEVITPLDPITLGKPLPNKIAIVGFADSKDEAPYGDPSWEIWGVNDVYAHVPRVDRSFELHDVGGLVEAGRRNPEYMKWLQKGKLPVYMWDAVIKSHPEFPSAVRFPVEDVMAAFGDYFTNSIAWQTAFALLCLCEFKDGQVKARENVELALFGVDMAHETEYGAQRPSCEYYIGLARALGVKVYIPQTSDLLKAGSLYGISTTAPMRIKLEKRIIKLNEQLNMLNAQRQQFQMQINHAEAQMNQIKGAIGAFKYTRGVWTNGTEIAPQTPGDHQRLLNPAVQQSDGFTIPVTEGGQVDIEALLSQQEA